MAPQSPMIADSIIFHPRRAVTPFVLVESWEKSHHFQTKPSGYPSVFPFPLYSHENPMDGEILQPLGMVFQCFSCPPVKSQLRAVSFTRSSNSATESTPKFFRLSGLLKYLKKMKKPSNLGGIYGMCVG